MRRRHPVELALLVFLLAGCAARLADPEGELVAEPEEFAARIRAETLPASPAQVDFAWTLEERGSRVSGQGVGRVEAPDRARIDLFGPRGETYLSAALVAGSYRLPPAVAAVALPSPALLWSALGALVPPRDATLATANETPTGAELRYERPDGEVFVYTFSGSSDRGFRLSRLQRANRSGVLETVSLEHDDTGLLTRTRYRDWTQYRDLILEFEGFREHDPFPSDIWRPDAV